MPYRLPLLLWKIKQKVNIGTAKNILIRFEDQSQTKKIPEQHIKQYLAASDVTTYITYPIVHHYVTTLITYLTVHHRRARARSPVACLI